MLDVSLFEDYMKNFTHRANKNVGNLLHDFTD